MNKQNKSTELQSFNLLLVPLRLVSGISLGLVFGLLHLQLQFLFWQLVHHNQGWTSEAACIFFLILTDTKFRPRHLRQKCLLYRLSFWQLTTSSLLFYASAIFWTNKYFLFKNSIFDNYMRTCWVHSQFRHFFECLAPPRGASFFEPWTSRAVIRCATSRPRRIPNFTIFFQPPFLLSSLCSPLCHGLEYHKGVNLSR